MRQFLYFGNLIFNAAQVVWIDFAAFDKDNKPAVEVKVIGDDQTWTLIGADRDAAFEWHVQHSSRINRDSLFAFGTKVFNLNEIRWVNRDYQDDNGRALEIVTTDGTSWKLKDDDADKATRYFDNMEAQSA
jgi:hypothetical protein